MSSTREEIEAAFRLAENLPGWGDAVRSRPADLMASVSARYEAGPCFPEPDRMFRAIAEVGPPEAVRVVILGQDPYHGRNQADGLAFSVRSGVPLPPSLRHIYREIAHSCGGVSPVEGALGHWVQQGVLLLNDVLTVGEGAPRSHAGLGWQELTASVLRALTHRPAAFMLWGNHARQAAPMIRSLNVNGEHLILEAPHPSPLSAYRGFHGCGHFAAVNTWLIGRGEAPIRWWPEGLWG